MRLTGDLWGPQSPTKRLEGGARKVVEIEEIIGRATQGVTRPFICRGDDSNIYFVKGAGAGRRSQICELVAGRLAVEFGLPIAPFELVTVPAELIALRARDDLADLGQGVAFGSRRCNVTELTRSRIADVPSDLARDVLAFDWWIRNADRTLTDQGGNPNLFWDVDHEALVVIDHNQAFDRTFSPTDFFGQHAFASEQHRLFSDWVAQEAYRQRMRDALLILPSVWASVPFEWRFVDPEYTVEADFDESQTEELLNRYQDVEFWRLA